MMKFRQVFSVLMLTGALTACTEQVTQKMEWQVQSSDKVDATGDILSTPTAKIDGWIPAKVPSTLMGILTTNGIEPEALTAEDYAKIDKKQFERSWWYRTTFNMPALKECEHALLAFDGICYRANVWLNGHQIANKEEMAGSFRQFEFDVTQQISDENVLAVEVFRAQPGEPNIGFADWNPRPADENMGIYREVRVKTCGAVAVSHSAVRSRVSENLDVASLTVATELTNLTDQPVSGIVRGSADGHEFESAVTLAAGEKKRFNLPEEIQIDNPRLWWSHDLGKPELCDLHVEFVETLAVAENDGKHSEVRVSDSEDIRFGIREIRSYLTAEGYRAFSLNGKEILLRGAGWTDDIYLRDTPERNRQQLEYVRHMNMNTVRLEGFWGTSQSLYDLCDELGLLVLVGWSCHWEWADYIGAPCDDLYGGILSPENIALVARSFEDQVMWLRRHPAIIGWFVGSDMLPKPELERQYIAFLKDNDDRDYLISAKDQRSEISGPSGTKMAGPYEYVGPDYWYRSEAPGGAFGFNTETGIGAQLPVRESLEKMLRTEQIFPIDDRWNILCTASASDMNSLRQLSEVIAARFGENKDIDEYLRRADLLNYESTRAMFESFRVRRPHTTGIIQWMLNSARPSIYWQLYDYYLLPNAAYYAVRKACTPQQLIYDYEHRAVYAVNETLTTFEGCAEMLIQIDGSFVSRDSIDTKKPFRCVVPPLSVVKVFDISDFGADTFLFLKLTDGEGKELATNEYFIPMETDTYDWPKSTWVNTPIINYASYHAIDTMTTSECELAYQSVGDGLYEVEVRNPTDRVALMIHLTAHDDEGKTLSPAYWSDNYLTLPPRSSRTVTLRIDFKDGKKVAVGGIRSM